MYLNQTFVKGSYVEVLTYLRISVKDNPPALLDVLCIYLVLFYKKKRVSSLFNKHILRLSF